jgi:hypothetical protein
MQLAHLLRFRALRKKKLIICSAKGGSQANKYTILLGADKESKPPVNAAAVQVIAPAPVEASLEDLIGASYRPVNKQELAEIR